ncbi:ACT domain-containing protein, partial [Actinotignum sanguinis]
PAQHPLATVHGAYNAIVVEGEAADRLMFYGPGAGGNPTATAVLSDLVAAAHHRVHGGLAPRELAYGELPILPPSQARSRFQLSMDVADHVGVLSEVTGTFARHNVSISGVSQESPTADHLCRLTVTTHEALQADVEATIADLSAAAGLATVRTASFVRVEVA